jgi:hypothetical protein
MAFATRAIRPDDPTLKFDPPLQLAFMKGYQGGSTDLTKKLHLMIVVNDLNRLHEFLQAYCNSPRGAEIKGDNKWTVTAHLSPEKVKQLAKEVFVQSIALDWKVTPS